MEGREEWGQERSPRAQDCWAGPRFTGIAVTVSSPKGLVPTWADTPAAA